MKRWRNCSEKPDSSIWDPDQIVRDFYRSQELRIPDPHEIAAIHELAECLSISPHDLAGELGFYLSRARERYERMEALVDAEATRHLRRQWLDSQT